MNHQSMSRKGLLFGGVMAAMLVISLIGIPSAFAAINSQLDLGDRGSEVTELQTYLSTNANIYPSGLVTGYFGPLTQAGVQRFQTAQGIVSSGTPATTGYGRVGPTTMARINALMGSGSTQAWDTVPVLNPLLVNFSNTNATFSWTTNELTQGQVYFDTAPLRADEATGPRQLPYVSGSLASQNNGLQISHTITIPNLQPNTLYYYLTRSIDSVGNMSMSWPSSFRTGQFNQ